MPLSGTYSNCSGSLARRDIAAATNQQKEKAGLPGDLPNDKSPRRSDDQFFLLAFGRGGWDNPSV
jgi:hypothetical protein